MAGYCPRAGISYGNILAFGVLQRNCNAVFQAYVPDNVLLCIGIFLQGKLFLFTSFGAADKNIVAAVFCIRGAMICLSQILTFNEKIPLWDAIKGLVFQNGENQILWFIAALYVYSLIFYWIQRFCRKDEILLIVCLSLFIANTAYSYWFNGSRIPWHISASGFACFYMALGKYYKRHEVQIDSKFSFKTLIAIAVIYFGYIALTGRSCSFSGSPYVADAILLTVMSLILGLAISKRFFQNSKFILFVGANTLFYFAFHGKGLSLFQTIVEKIMYLLSINHSTILDLVLSFVIVILDALLLIIPAMIVNKWFPFVLGRGFKLWKS